MSRTEYTAARMDGSYETAEIGVRARTAQAGPVHTDDPTTLTNLRGNQLDRAIAGAASVIFTEYTALGLPQDEVDRHIDFALDPTRSRRQVGALIATASDMMRQRGIVTEGLPVLDVNARRLHRKAVQVSLPKK